MLRIENIRGTVNLADLMTKHLDGKRLMTLCELLNIKRFDGRPSSTPKLAIDTAFFSRTSRALAAMTLVKRASGSEIAVRREVIQETWIDGYGIDWWIEASWILVLCMWYPDKIGAAMEKILESYLDGRR